VRQLDAVAARVLAGLARHARLISTGEPVTYLDIDDAVRSTFGYAKQGAGYGYTGVKGLNALLATVSSASSAPVIAATRLRKGSANSARGAARLVADAIKTTRSAGVSGQVVPGAPRPTTAPTSSPPPADTEHASPSPPAKTGP
jgi:hypothetical protein